MKQSSVFECSILHFKKNHQKKGNITAINNGIDVPFDIRRVYYLYDIPGGEGRGAHAHKNLKQLIIAASGSFNITVDDSKSKRTYNLSKPYIGLFLPSGLWRELNNFSSGSICLVLASKEYDANDYIRDYEKFLQFKKTE